MSIIANRLKGTCKPGQTAASTGCTPVSGSDSSGSLAKPGLEVTPLMSKLQALGKVTNPDVRRFMLDQIREEHPEAAALLADYGPEPTKPSTPTHPSTATVADLTDSFDRMDRGHNFVHLADLRAAVPGASKEDFDRLLDQAQREGKLVLSPGEGRFGITERDREAAVYEPDPLHPERRGNMMLYVSRRNPTKYKSVTPTNRLKDWITIGGSPAGGEVEHRAGTHVFVDESGRISRGPSGLTGRHIGEVDRGRRKPGEKPKPPSPKNRLKPEAQEEPTHAEQRPTPRPEEVGPSVASTSEGAGDATTDTGRQGEGEPAGRSLAEDASRRGTEGAGRQDAQQLESAYVVADLNHVNKRLDHYEQLFRSKGQEQQADWMKLLKSHINDVGTEQALKELGEERAAGDRARVVYEGEKGGWESMDDFTHAYLNRHGIVPVQNATTRANISSLSQKFTAGGSEDGYTTGDLFTPKDPGLPNKLEEAKRLPGLESSEDINVLMGKPVTHLTDDVARKMDERYGVGKWIVKVYGDDAYAGFGIFFPQRVTALKREAQDALWSSGVELANYGFKHLRDESGTVVGIQHNDGDKYEFGSEKYRTRIYGAVREAADKAAAAAKNEQGPALLDRDGKISGKEFMVQPAFAAVGISDAERARGVTGAEGGKGEGRVHIVTQGGKAEIVPHSTWIKGEWLPVVFESDDTRAMAQVAVDAINALPESERQGQIYAPDVMRSEEGYRVIEANPANHTGSSGYLGDNPFIIDSYVSHILGQEPQHTKFIRSLLLKKRGGNKKDLVSTNRLKSWRKVADLEAAKLGRDLKAMEEGLEDWDSRIADLERRLAENRAKRENLLQRIADAKQRLSGYKNLPVNRLIVKQRHSLQTQQHRPTVAVDFDGRISEYPDHHNLSRTPPREGAKRALQRFRRAGIKVLIWTSRPDVDAVEAWFKQHGIPYDAININPDYEPGSRKLTADMYLDDRGEGDPDADWDELTELVFGRLFGKARQPVDDWERLEELAGEAQPELEKLLSSVIPNSRTVRLSDDLLLGEFESNLLRPGPVVVLPSAKAFKRAKEKVESDYDGRWDKLLDVNRGAIAFDTMKELEAAADRLKDLTRLARPPKDRFAEPLANGYRDLMFNPMLPCGMICEVQLHLKPMLIAREREKLSYDVVRAIHAALEREGRSDLTPAEAEAVRRTRKMAKRLYARAWEQCQTDRQRDDILAQTKSGKTYYHGSSTTVLPPGSFRLLPSSATGRLSEQGRKVRLDRVFFTEDVGSARIYAGRAVSRFGGEPVVYRVIPQGDVEVVQSAPGTTVYSSPGGFLEETKGLFNTVQEAGKFLAGQWGKLESRYGRKGALAMAVAMLGTAPIPGNIAAVIAVAEGIRGVHGYFQQEFDGDVEKLVKDGTVMDVAPRYQLQFPVDRLKDLARKNGESYFATCDRDKKGRCLPSGEGGGTGGAEDKPSDGASAAEKPKGKKAPPGSQLPKETLVKLKELGADKLPPADVPVTDVHINLEAGDSGALLVWKQKSRSGRVSQQSAYTASFHAKNAAEKWNRVERVEPFLEKIQDGLTERMNDTGLSQRQREAAAITSCIHETGLRPTDSAESVKHGHFGISSLQGRHVKIKGDEVHLDFIGKEGVRNQTTIRNPANVAFIKQAMANTGPKDFLFREASSADAIKTLKEISKGVGGPEDILVKDLRTVNATRWGQEAVERFKGPPPPLTGNRKKDESLIKKAILTMAGEVSKRLNNSPEMARDNYIHPRVFQEWRKKLEGS